MHVGHLCAAILQLVTAHDLGRHIAHLAENAEVLLVRGHVIVVADEQSTRVRIEEEAAIVEILIGIALLVQLLDESPDVPNFGTAGRGVRLCAGMTLAIEPMVNIGSSDVYVLDDGWTVKTRDASLSAHYENTVALTSEGAMILTLIDKEW